MNRISVYSLSAEEQSRSGKLYGIIDGAHRVSALIKLRQSKPELADYLNAAVYENVPEDVILYASSILNEASETVVKTSVIDRLFFFRNLLRSNLLPAGCKNRMGNIVKDRVRTHLKKISFPCPTTSLQILHHLQWAKPEFVDYLIQQAMICPSLHIGYSLNIMTLFHAKAKTSSFELRKAFIDRLVVASNRRLNKEMNEEFNSAEEIVSIMCARAEKAANHINGYLVEVGSLTGMPPIRRDELTADEENFCQELLSGCNLACDIHLRDSNCKLGLFGKFDMFLEKREADIAAARDASLRATVDDGFDDSADFELITGCEAKLDDSVDPGSSSLSLDILESVSQNDFTNESQCHTSSSPEGAIADGSNVFLNPNNGSELCLPIGDIAASSPDDLQPIPASTQNSLRISNPKRLFEDDDEGFLIAKRKKKPNPKSRTSRRGKGKGIGNDPDEDVPPPNVSEELQEEMGNGNPSMIEVVESLGGSFECANDTSCFEVKAQLVIVQAHGLKIAELIPYVSAAGRALTEHGTCLILCRSAEYWDIRMLVATQRHLIPEPEPLVIVMHKDAYDDLDKRGGQGNFMIPSCFMCIVAHRTALNFEVCYDKNVTIPLDSRQYLPGRANVITGYKQPDVDESISARMPQELNVELFRLLVSRYSLPDHNVFGLPMGTGNVGVGALWEKRRFFGVDPDPVFVQEAVGRCYRKYLKYKGSFGINKAVMPDTDRLPDSFEASFHSPPDLNEIPSGTDDVAAANIDGRPFGVKVQKSGIQGAGLGLWATHGIKAGATIGYYWGLYFFSRDESISQRVMLTQKRRLGPDGIRQLFIDGSPRCAITYINDPLDSKFAQNAMFVEDNFDNKKPDVGETTSPAIWRIMRAVARVDIPMDCEILANYHNNYFGEDYQISASCLAPRTDDNSEAADADESSIRDGIAIESAGGSSAIDNGMADSNGEPSELQESGDGNGLIE